MRYGTARLGISPETHVVLYVFYGLCTITQFNLHSLTHFDLVSYDTHGVFSSPRALYMFRAFGHHRSSILDGGLPGWQAHGGVTEDGQASAVASQSEYPPPTLRKDIVKGESRSE